MKLNEELAKEIIGPRRRNSHKGDYGRVLLIGGLYPYGGAIIMSAIATVKSGAGLVTVATEKENIPALHNHLAEAMAFSVDDQDFLQKTMITADVILIGPGLGDNSKAEELLKTVLQGVSPEQILIIDGSALTLLAEEDVSILKNKQVILTPHQKEWERLSKLAIADQNPQASQKALMHFPLETILVAKSDETTLISTEEISLLDVGGPYQATGGMGDTLAGMIAGFVAQFKQKSIYKVVAAATYLHSAIADDLARDNYVVLPTQISDSIQKWMNKYAKAD